MMTPKQRYQKTERNTASIRWSIEAIAYNLQQLRIEPDNTSFARAIELHAGAIQDLIARNATLHDEE